MKTFTLNGTLCVEVRREHVRAYLGSGLEICTPCPMHDSGRCTSVPVGMDMAQCPVDEIAVPVRIAQSPEFITSLLETA